MTTKSIGNVRIVKGEDGKTRIERVHKYRSISAAIAAKKSKRQRVVRRTA